MKLDMKTFLDMFKHVKVHLNKNKESLNENHPVFDICKNDIVSYMMTLLFYTIIY